MRCVGGAAGVGVIVGLVAGWSNTHAADERRCQHSRGVGSAVARRRGACKGNTVWTRPEHVLITI